MLVLVIAASFVSECVGLPSKVTIALSTGLSLGQVGTFLKIGIGCQSTGRQSRDIGNVVLCVVQSIYRGIA